LKSKISNSIHHNTDRPEPNYRTTYLRKVTIRPGFSRTVLYFWVLSWISWCPGFVLDLKSSGKCVSYIKPDGKLHEIWSV